MRAPIVAFSALALFAAPSVAIPSGELTPRDPNPLAHPFVGASLPSQQDYTASPFSNVFRRQGCPGFTLLCPSGVCCPYEGSCCGTFCCNSGYVCMGGSTSAPRCVAIGDLSATCGGSNNENPCTRPGDLPCQGINICCPPDNLCYYDTAGYPRCSPLSSPPPSPPPPPPPPPSPPPDPDGFSGGSGDSFGGDSSSTTDSDPSDPEASNPDDGFDPDSSRRPKPSPSSGDRFWTPAAKGGVAGGTIAGVILIVVAIGCCRRHCFPSSTATASATPRHWYDFRHHQPLVSPLSDPEIYWLIKDLDTPQAWQDAYVAEARRIPAAQTSKDEGSDSGTTGSTSATPDPAAWMRDFAARAVAIRIQQLKDGGGRKWAWVKSGTIGCIPFGTTVVGQFYDVIDSFRNIAISAVGLGDSSQTASLRAQAKAATKSTWLDKLGSGAEWAAKEGTAYWWNHADLAAEVRDAMMRELSNEFGAEAAQEVGNQMVHMKPGLGQAISSGTAIWRADARMKRALEWLEPLALRFHLETLAVNALTEVFG